MLAKHTTIVCEDNTYDVLNVKKIRGQEIALVINSKTYDFAFAIAIKKNGQYYLCLASEEQTKVLLKTFEFAEVVC